MRGVATAIIGFVCLFFMTRPVFAEPTFLPDASGCKVYDPSPKPNEVVTWSGACKDGLADGPGKVEWVVDGKVASTEEGSFRAGKLNGHAVIHYPGGEVYEGDVVEGLTQGHGVLTNPDGSRREGTFEKGVLQYNAEMKTWYTEFTRRLNESIAHNRGPALNGRLLIAARLDPAKKITTWQLKTSSGSDELDAYILGAANRLVDPPVVPTTDDVVFYNYRYGAAPAGLAAMAKPTVQAPNVLIADRNGCQAEVPQPDPGKAITWTGGCKDNLLDGAGVLTWTDARDGPYSIEGTFVRGQAQSPAVVTFADQRKYQGELTHNSVTGIGELSDADGDRYVGDFIEGKFGGQGKIVYADHATYSGGWYDDKRSGPGDFTDADGSRFQGSYLKGARWGYGILDATGRVRYAGKFAGDKPMGPVSYASRYGGAEPTMVEYKPVNLQVESYKTYRQLTPDERALVNAQFPQLAPGDEPPYPSHGLLGIYHELLRLESLYLMSGSFSMVVNVDSSGQPTKVEVLKSPDDDLSKEVVDFVMRQQFKPATCAKVACAMNFPITVSLLN